VTGASEKIEVEEVIPEEKNAAAGQEILTVTNRYDRGEFKKDLRAGVILLALCILAIMLLFDTFHVDITVPLVYQGGDEFSTLTNARSLTEQAWNLTANRLGAPGIAEYYEYPTSTLHNADLLILKIYSFFTDKVGLIMNLTYFTLICLVALNTFGVLRVLSVRRSLAGMAGMLYAFSPYMFWRSESHIVLSAYMFLPFSMLLCIFMYTDPDYMKIGRKWPGDWRNWATVVFAFLIGNNGIIYYPFMTGFALLSVGVARALTDRDIRKVFRSLIPSLMIILFMALAYMPSLIHILVYGKTSGGVDRSGALSSAEEYGLKIIQLFLPFNSKGSWTLSQIIDREFINLEPINENMSSYLGVIAAIGFVILMFVLLDRRKHADVRRWQMIECLSVLTLGVTLLGISDGLGTMVAFVTNLGLRGYNRVSIFLMLFALTGLALLLDGWLDRHPKREKMMLPVLAVVTALGLWDQFGQRWDVLQTEAQMQADEWYSDEAFGQKLEDTEEDGAMILQLPYHTYPEQGPVRDMSDYHELTEYIHTSTLRFSYGSMNGSVADRTVQQLTSLPLEEMVRQAQADGWAGICIDRRAYTDEESEDLTKEFSELLAGKTHFVSENENLEYFSFSN
jgi:hypothetical protein